MKRTLLPEILDILRCPSCREAQSLTNGSGRIRCTHCRFQYPLREGYVDLHPGHEETITPIQHLCQFPPMIAVYDNIWRPFGYFLTSARSFARDQKRIVSILDPKRHGMVLDLACGPGNFTRDIAELGKNTTVIGFDLAREMLNRAANQSRAAAHSRVCYMRGNALDMPFAPESFDAVICCAALQLFTDRDRALAEIARVLKPGGEFVCQTIVTPGSTPIWLRLADRVMRFGYFRKDQLKGRLDSLGFEVVDEEYSKVSFIFRAAKRCL